MIRRLHFVFGPPRRDVHSAAASLVNEVDTAKMPPHMARPQCTPQQLFPRPSVPLDDPRQVIEWIKANGGRSDTDFPRERVARAGARSNTRRQSKPAAPLRFIDLFCGIGGFRLAFEHAGASCVFSSDWDKFSRQTYAANFGEEPHGDINQIPIKDIPAHDILCGGFPCQPFSIAGVSKKNSLGRKHGFEDERQGNLFFSVAAILDHHQPRAI